MANHIWGDGWTTGRTTILTSTGEREVKAYIKHPFAITLLDESDTCEWSLTHISTGKGIAAHFNNHLPLLALAESFMAIVPPTDPRWESGDLNAFTPAEQEAVKGAWHEWDRHHSGWEPNVEDAYKALGYIQIFSHAFVFCYQWAGATTREAFLEARDTIINDFINMAYPLSEDCSVIANYPKAPSFLDIMNTDDKAKWAAGWRAFADQFKDEDDEEEGGQGNGQ